MIAAPPLEESDLPMMGCDGRDAFIRVSILPRIVLPQSNEVHILRIRCPLLVMSQVAVGDLCS
jgi:hypothetical protein